MEWLEANRDTKFFMFLHSYKSHAPYLETYFLEQGEHADILEKRKALYDGNIRRVDDFFGQFVNKLRSLGLFSNTIIVVVSDHGEHFYDHFAEADRIPPEPTPIPQTSTIAHGHSVYDELIRIPMIFYLPGLQPKKSIYEEQIRLVDVLPTVLDYLGLSHEGPVQGESLLPLMRTGQRLHDSPAISEFTHTGPEQKSVRMGGYKYIYTGDPDERKQEVSFRNIPKYALFDLKSDPGEKNNIYSQNKALAEEYHDILQKTLEESRAINRELREKRKPGEVDSNPMPEDVTNALKALGYLQ
jgi:arylsulfatase A-like enzyme